MKVLMQAHTIDEHGSHIPGDVIELGASEAQVYVERGWGVIIAEEKRVIETPEAKGAAAKKETAALKRTAGAE